MYIIVYNFVFHFRHEIEIFIHIVARKYNTSICERGKGRWWRLSEAKPNADDGNEADEDELRGRWTELNVELSSLVTRSSSLIDC